MTRSIRDLWRFRELAGILVVKELKLRYRRSVLGLAWTMLNPLMTMIILSIVFSHVMRVKVDHFPVFVLSALLPWNFFAQSLGGGAYAVIHNESLLRNIWVPRAVFPLALVTSHLVNLLFALVPLLVVMLWQGVPIRPAALALPLYLLTLWLFTSGIVLALSAWTVVLRDLGQIVEILLTGLFYLTPIIYPLALLPEKAQFFFRFNPLIYEVTSMRMLFYDGALPSAAFSGAALVLSVVSFVVGLALFRRRESTFLHYLS